MVARAFVIGTAAWDETLHLAALPAPGASVHVRRGAAGPGGKAANQAVVLSRAGVPVTLVATIGRDARGEALASALTAEGLGGGLMRRDVSTDWSVILLTPDGENAILTTREAAAALDAATITAALTDGRRGDLCLLQGNLGVAATGAAVAAARAAGMTVAMNPSPVDRDFAALFPEADVLIVNREEGLAFAGSTEPPALRGLGAGQVVLTQGAEGALLVSRAAVETVLAEPARAVDPTGAGDTFLAAALAHAAPRGWRVDAAALRAGARAAALTVARAGAFAALPSREELVGIMGVP